MIRLSLRLLSFISIVLLVITSFDYWQFQKQREQRTIDSGQQTIERLARDVNQLLSEVTQEASQLTQQLEQVYRAGQTVSRVELRQWIEASARNLPQVLGVTVSFEPYAFDPDQRLYSPYYDKRQSRFIQIETVYDYTNEALETAQWYVQTRSGARWIEPYFAEGAQALVADYGVPFFNDGQLLGTVTVTIALDQFADLIHNLTLGKAATGFVASAQGTILAHQNEDLIGQADLADLAAQIDSQQIQTAYDNLLAQDSGMVQFANNELDNLFFFQPVQPSQWLIGVSFFVDELARDILTLKRKKILLSIAICMTILFLLATFFVRDDLDTPELVTLSLLATTMLAGNILYIGQLQHNVLDKDVTYLDGSEMTKESQPLLNLEAVDGFVNAVQREADVKIVPTAFYIERLDLVSSYNMNVSGQVWQRYPLNVDESQQGIRFPQVSPFAEASLIELVSRHEREDYVELHYDFRVTLRLNFNYAKYPFDKRHINIQIAPLSDSIPLYFVPDLNFYKVTSPGLKPGIDPTVYLPGNDILSAYYTFKTYQSDVINRYSTSQTLPQMFFNIDIRRALINAFVTYLIPILVVLVMIFILLYATAKPKSADTHTGIIEAMAAFFFVLIFSHIDLRKTIETPEVMYMEYFYFAAYIIVALSTFNLIIYTRRTNTLFEYKNNLLMKVAYWPLFFLIIYTVTLVKFY